MNARWIAALLAAASLPALAAQVAGVTLQDTASVGGQQLVLNGAGLRTKFGLADVYVLGLYLPAKSSDANAIINDKAPRRVALVMKRDLDADTLQNAFHEGLEANVSKAELQQLQPKIRQLDARFKEVGAVKKGDVLNLDFGADGSTRITYNGQQKEAVAGADLSSALLKIWLGSHPVQDSLKKDMLKS
ncbi:MAG: putative periplasmic protein [Nevskia sp.]|nr:putative periplasmic protein [Nevskia sp.]